MYIYTVYAKFLGSCTHVTLKLSCWEIFLWFTSSQTKTPHEGSCLGGDKPERTNRNLHFWGHHGQRIYVQILEATLLPFIRDVYHGGHKFMQDNDPKHASKYAKAWMEDNDVYWWRTPPESPDLNPIENLWHQLKEFIRRETKPKTKNELTYRWNYGLLGDDRHN